jgi:hypothetical protein
MQWMDHIRLSVCLAVPLGACSDDGAGTGTGEEGTTSLSAGDDATMSSSATLPTTEPTDSSVDSTIATEPPTSDTGSASSTDPDATGDTTTGNDPMNPVDCDGTIYECGDGIDNDRDGAIDLGDPECTGPCDDDEGSFQTGLPGDNVDCKQDCFFDGDSGHGNDGCEWDLKCDPANPGANIMCEYTGGQQCENSSPNVGEDCIMFCEQYVPPGCDCFGCCTVQTEDGPVDIFLNSGPDCSIDNIDACEMCTSHIDECGNPCEPETCEVCFGETEAPEGCDENTCTSDLPCQVTEDCPTDYFCYLDCCYPPPPG